MKTHSSSCLTPVLCLFFVLLTFAPLIGRAAPAEAKISESALRQIQALQAEKESRSAIHRKLDSQFVFKLKQNRKQVIAAGVTELRPDLEVQPDGRVRVDIDADISKQLLERIASGGGTVLHSSPKYHSIHALVPLEQLEGLAEIKNVRFIRRAILPRTNIGSVTSQGDITHLANFVRTNYAFTGVGVKVGVISDGIAYLKLSQNSGNLPEITVLPGQDGPSDRAEGRAMMEIVHDLAPDAQLYYATAFNGEASFAENILNLRSNGCDIIVDDVMYFDESPFQDGIIAQAVNAVTASGALYFSSAGNEGNFKDATTGTWEGNFVDSGQTLPGYTGRIHSFGGTNYNQVLTSGQGVDLFWADPLGASTNDYDLFLLNSTGTTVLYAANNPQTGTQDPYEFVNQVASSGTRVVVVRRSGAARFLHVDTYRGKLGLRTTGATRGHSAATNAISVAAVNAFSAYPNPFVAGSTKHVETYSCDGPRRVFFQADGTAITPGNFTATGGALRQKPDLTAADGVSTSVYGYNPFNGSSAAAPHAAAIAALVLSGNPHLAAGQLRAILTNAVLDIEAPGYDINSGSGILMADRAVSLMPQQPVLFAGIPVILNETIPNGALDPDETVTVRLPLTNMGFVPSTNVVATLLNTGGVTAASSPQTYGTLAARGGTAGGTFSFMVTGSCGGVVTATLRLQDGPADLGTVRFVFPLGTAWTPLAENFDGVTAPFLPSGWTISTTGLSLGWQSSADWSESGSNSVHIVDADTACDSSLISPPFTISTASAQLSFTRYQNLYPQSPAQRGGVLEISTNGGPFLDILEIGGNFLKNGYNDTVPVWQDSPLAGRQVWAGNGGRFPTIVNLPAGAAGQTLRLRLRFATTPNDCSCYLDTSWSVDSIVCNDGTACSTASPNDVTVTSASSSSYVYLTRALDFILKVANSGPDAATNVIVTNLLPTGFNLTSWTASSGVSLVSTSGSTMIFSITTLPGGEIKTITLSGVAGSVGVLSNATTIARSDGGSVSVIKSTALATIVPAGIVINDVSFWESDANTSNAVFTVSLTTPIATNVSVRFATADLTATAGKDYVSTNGTLIFPPGVVSQTIAVRVLDDLLSEASEQFTMTLSTPTNCDLVRATAIGTILDDDPWPYLNIDPTNFVIEKPDSGTTNVVLNVTLSPASGQTIRVNVGTTVRTAFPGRDYSIPNPSTVTFAPGETNKTIVVVVTNHASVKPSQDFEVDLTGYVNGAYVINGSAVGTIITASPSKLDHFIWNPVSLPQSNGLPFNVTIGARDFNEAPATNFNGSVSLNGFFVSGYRTNVLFASVDTQDLYGSPSNWGYSFTPATNLLATHLRAYLISYQPDYPIKASLWTDTGTLLATLYLNSTNDHAWLEGPLSPPIELKAGRTYRVGVSFGILKGFLKPALLPPDSPDIAFVQTYSSGSDGFPGTIVGTNNPVLPMVDVRYTAGITAPIGIVPGSSANFTNGTWTGAVRVQQPATNVFLMASDDNSHWGISSSFNVNQFVLPPPLLSQVKLVTNKLQFSWNAVPGLYYQVQYKTNLKQATWQNLNVPILATNNATLWSALIGPDPQRFFRLQASLTPPQPMLQASVSSGALQLSWSAVVNGSYQIQYKTNLTQTSWVNLGSPIMATNSAMTWPTAIGPEPCRFFRLLVGP